MRLTKYAAIWCLCLCVETSPEFVSAEIETFAAVMLKESVRLCRTANICGTNRSESEIRAKQSDIISCCQDCSCDEKCADFGDCCFPTPQDQASKRDNRRHQECIAPLTKSLIPTEFYKYSFYYMTTMCPAGKDVSLSEAGEDCGNIAVAPWGSLLPVYSQKTGKIYKNRVCSNCHGIRDGVEWNVFMDCKEVDASQTRYVSVSENFEWLSKNRLPDNCQFRFAFSQPLEKERCLRGIIDTCNETQITVPGWSEMTEDQIVSSCHNGIDAPYQFYRAYANVFCFLCNGGVSFETENCFFPDFEPHGELSGGFTCLLDTSSLQSARSVETIQKTSPPQACSRQRNTKDSCVPLYCPSGQVYNNKVHCVHLASSWNIPYYHIALRLKSAVTDRMKTSTLMTLLQGSSDFSTWLQFPWPIWWSVNSLHFEIGIGTLESSYVDSFIITIKMRPRGRPHKAVLKEIKRLMKKTWTVEAPQRNISLSADFLEYSDVHEMSYRSQIQTVPNWHSFAARQNQLQDAPSFRDNSILPIIQRVEHLQQTGNINKMNFCKQVPLGVNSSNYNILAAQSLLSYNGTFFFDGEFELVNTVDGTLEPRICVEDSEYIEKKVVKSGSPEICLFWFQIFMSILMMFSNINYN